jgi:hypothetical protein
VNKVYRSKIDTQLGIILGGMPVALLFVVWELLHAQIPGRWLIAIPILLLGVCLPVSILMFTTYTITDNSLGIRSGFFKWDIPIQQITGVKPTNDPRSSPALSLDRIRIEYGQAESVTISPIDKEEFIRSLRDRGVPDA